MRAEARGARVEGVGRRPSRAGMTTGEGKERGG